MHFTGNRILTLHNGINHSVSVGSLDDYGSEFQGNVLKA